MFFDILYVQDNGLRDHFLRSFEPMSAKMAGHEFQICDIFMFVKSGIPSAAPLSLSSAGFLAPSMGPVAQQFGGSSHQSILRMSSLIASFLFPSAPPVTKDRLTDLWPLMGG